MLVLIFFMLGKSYIHQQPDARHHPPAHRLNKHSSYRMKAALFAFGCMPLLGCLDKTSQTVLLKPLPDICGNIFPTIF